MADRKFEEWVSIYRSGTDYEADLVRDRLDDSGISAVVLTQRDHAFNLTVGEMAPVWVLVPPDEVEAARQVLESEPFTDAELERIALAANPDLPAAHDRRRESMLDSGAEEIRFRDPDDEPSEDG